jgi:hypothetical protein
MNETHFETWLTQKAKEMQYPPTPQFADYPSSEKPRPRLTATLRWALTVIVIAAALMAVPPVRAQLLEWLQIGGMTIERAATPLPADALPPPVDLVTGYELSGKTTLAQATAEFGFPIRYPPAYGKPQHVYLQDFGTGPFVVLVWVDLDDPAQVILVEYILAPGTRLTKGEVPTLEETQVNGQPAVWTDGPYMVNIQGFHQAARLVEGHALIWEQDGLTYRLELDASLKEAVRIAESIK